MPHNLRNFGFLASALIRCPWKATQFLFPDRAAIFRAIWRDLGGCLGFVPINRGFRAVSGFMTVPAGLMLEKVYTLYPHG